MPVAYGLSRRVDDLLPVVSAAVVGDFAAEIDNTDVVIAAEPVVVHDNHLHEKYSL